MVSDRLTGKYFKADHPITCMNPREWNKIAEVKVKWCNTSNRVKVYVRGVDTMWFCDNVIEHIVDEVER